MTVSLDDEQSSSESSDEQLGSYHWIVNIDDMIERDLDHSEYWELMQGEGKVIEILPAGYSDFPSVLVGFTEEQVYDEILPLLYSLPLADILETVHSVLRKYRIHYECKNLIGTDTYIFDFPQIEAGRLIYIEVRPKLINPGYSLYDGFSFPDATYDHWGEWGRLLHSQMTRKNLEKAIDHWHNAQYRGEMPTPEKLASMPSLPTRAATLAKWRATWRLIQDWVNKGMNASDIEKPFSQLEGVSHLPGDAKTLRKIIEAGKAGHFEDLP